MAIRASTESSPDEKIGGRWKSPSGAGFLGVDSRTRSAISAGDAEVVGFEGKGVRDETGESESVLVPSKARRRLQAVRGVGAKDARRIVEKTSARRREIK